MIDKVKKYGIIIIIVIIFTLFSFSVVELIKPQPNYNDYCAQDSRPFIDKQGNDSCPLFENPSKEEQLICSQSEGFIEYTYDSVNCPISYECNTCQAEYNKASKDFRLLGFIVTSVMGLIAIIVGMYTTSKKNATDWIISGLLIGGISTVFFGTAQYFSDMGRYARPAILLVEFILIVWIALRIFKDDKNKLIK
ncbi:MAG: hypothetical protein PF569_03590 [Candidatus Woesearchaeota archaeon]|jgi:heme/copper-type cytochrome/quinol oxidase subunit 4|nr:hypothetical protein [Candidatus Woesearchaeota archaeon]